MTGAVWSAVMLALFLAGMWQWSKWADAGAQRIGLWFSARADRRLLDEVRKAMAPPASAPIAPVAPAPVLVMQTPTPPCIVFRFVWWNGCRMEIDPGIHAANAVAHCCWARTKERA